MVKAIKSKLGFSCSVLILWVFRSQLYIERNVINCSQAVTSNGLMHIHGEREGSSEFKEDGTFDFKPKKHVRSPTRCVKSTENLTCKWTFHFDLTNSDKLGKQAYHGNIATNKPLKYLDFWSHFCTKRVNDPGPFHVSESYVSNSFSKGSIRKLVATDCVNYCHERETIHGHGPKIAL